MYVGIEQSIVYGDEGTAILDTTVGIVDTGTTLLLLATGARIRHTYLRLPLANHGAIRRIR